MHQRDVAVPACPGGLEFGLALGSGLTVPVAAVDVVGDDIVAEGPHHRGDAAAGLEVRRTHIPGLLAKDVDIGLLQLGHLGGELR